MFYRHFRDLGILELIETYEFYDRPVLFLCRNAADNLFLVVWAHEDSESEYWLFAPVSKKRLEHVRSGAIDLNDAFALPEDGLLHVVKVPLDKSQGITTSTIEAASVQRDWLPFTGEVLELETTTLAKLDPDLPTIASQTRRERLRVALAFPGWLRSEAPTALLGAFLQSMQDFVNSVGEAAKGTANLTGPVPKDILTSMAMSTVAAGGGSFEIEFASTQPVNFFDDSDIAVAFNDVLNIISVSPSAEDFQTHLKALQTKVVLKYLNLLHSMSDVEEARFQWASPKEKRFRTEYIRSDSIAETISAIEQMEDETATNITIIGDLIGGNCRTGRFEVETKESSYSGKTLPDAIMALRHATLGRKYRVTLRETRKLKPMIDTVQVQYFLVELKPFGWNPEDLAPDSKELGPLFDQTV
jgi:hypothetical protein